MTEQGHYILKVSRPTQPDDSQDVLYQTTFPSGHSMVWQPLPELFPYEIRIEYIPPKDFDD